MMIARYRALTPSTATFALAIISVEMMIARYRALTPAVCFHKSLSFPVEMMIARYRALTHIATAFRMWSSL